MHLATVATWALLLLAAPSAAEDQYEYTSVKTAWGSDNKPTVAKAPSTAVIAARSEIECASVCESTPSACFGVAWCPPDRCWLMGDAAEVSAALPAGCRALALTSRRRISGGWCPWSVWSTWTAACPAGYSKRSRQCRCPQPQALGAGCKSHTQPDGDAALLDEQFIGWCAWSGWSRWSSGCNKSQQRSRTRSCTCNSDSVPNPSTKSSDRQTRFMGWCTWTPWGGWSGNYRGDCYHSNHYRKRRTRNRGCNCVKGYTANPSGRGSQTDETGCFYRNYYG